MNDPLSLALAAREDPGREALRWGDSVWTFSTLAEHVQHASALLALRGLGPGGRLALKAPNGLAAFVAILAALELGATLVPLHPRLTPDEDRTLLSDAAPSLVLSGDDAEALLNAHRPLLPLSAELERGRGGEAAILYTSGTSGRPKGARLSRRALVAAAAASAQNLGFLPGERWLLCLPLCHIGGLSVVTRSLIGRGSVVLAPGFEPEAVLGLIARHRPTLLSVVPTMLHALLERDRDNRLSTLRAVLVGGSAAPDALLDECAARRVLALTTYGMTEACSQVTTQAPRDAGEREPGVGRPLPGVEVQIVDERGQEVEAGQVGVVQVRGPAMMDGYLHGVPLEGWFDTGDLGSWDEARRLRLQARRTDLIVTGGENVYPAEVEAALGGLDGVAASLVFGSPDPVWGQIVAAAIVARGAVDEAALKAQIDARLASHKRPRLVCFVDALPLGSTGKPLRREALPRFGGRLRRWGG